MTRKDRDSLSHLFKALVWGLQQETYGLNLPALQGEGFLQHYGFPTEMIDLTSSLDVAFTFASCGGKSRGRVAVLPTPRPEHGILEDLRNEQDAVRPKRQHAFGFKPDPALRDLKSESAHQELNIEWFEFPISRQEKEQAEIEMASLIEYKSDPMAGTIRSQISQYTEVRPRFSKILTERLIKRLPMVPLVYQVDIVDHKSSASFVRYITPTNLVFDERTESEASFRYWCKDFRDPRQKLYPYKNSTEKDSFFIVPGTWHSRCEDGIIGLFGSFDRVGNNSIKTFLSAPREP